MAWFQAVGFIIWLGCRRWGSPSPRWGSFLRPKAFLVPAVGFLLRLGGWAGPALGFFSVPPPPRRVEFRPSGIRTTVS